MLRKRSTYVIGGAILFAFVVGFLVGVWNAEPTETNIPAELFEQTSLLTWKGWSGDICFLIIPRIERGRAFHDLTSKWPGRCGISKLKAALAALPKDTFVEWSDWPPKFTYPEASVSQELFEFAK